jgi:hypothetical protein
VLIAAGSGNNPQTSNPWSPWNDRYDLEASRMGLALHPASPSRWSASLKWFAQIASEFSCARSLTLATAPISSTKTNGDIDTVLQRASDVIKSNLDSHAGATISFPAQVQLAANLGMSAEDHTRALVFLPSTGK